MILHPVVVPQQHPYVPAVVPEEQMPGNPGVVQSALGQTASVSGKSELAQSSAPSLLVEPP